MCSTLYARSGSSLHVDDPSAFVDFRGEKIQKLCGVMGVEWPYDPDDSYELTTDNLKKILAIHMRFRLDDLFASLLVLVKLAK